MEGGGLNNGIQLHYFIIKFNLIVQEIKKYLSKDDSKIFKSTAL